MAITACNFAIFLIYKLMTSATIAEFDAFEFFKFIRFTIKRLSISMFSKLSFSGQTWVLDMTEVNTRKKEID